jgi:hypothetical protein
MQANQPKDPRDVMLDLVEGGLVLLLDAVKAGDPQREIIWRIEEELRQVRRRNAVEWSGMTPEWDNRERW